MREIGKTMPDQLSIFASEPAYPDGFRYAPEVISSDDERDIVAHVRALAFREFEFHGFVGKRRVASFGWRYEFATESLRHRDLPRRAVHLPAAAEVGSEVGARLTHRRPTLGVSASGRIADGVGAQHPRGGRAALPRHLPEHARRHPARVTPDVPSCTICGMMSY